MFVTDYINKGNWNSKVGLGTDVPSKIVRLSLGAYGGEVICQRGAFLAGSHTIDIQVIHARRFAPRAASAARYARSQGGM